MNRWQEYLGKAAIALALMGFLTTFAISYRSAGMAEGFRVAESELDEFKAQIGYSDKIRLSGQGFGTYDVFARHYGWLVWLFASTTAILIWDRYRTSSTLPLSGVGLVGIAMATALYHLRTLIRDKLYVEVVFWEAPRNKFAYDTIALDWILVALAVVIFVFQIPRIVSLFRSRVSAETI
jgi:hypothetical protein